MCNIPPVEARTGTAFPRDYPRAKPEGHPEDIQAWPEMNVYEYMISFFLFLKKVLGKLSIKK